MSSEEKEKELEKKIGSKWDIYIYTMIMCLNQGAFVIENFDLLFLCLICLLPLLTT